jgi:hypothetical protein
MVHILFQITSVFPKNTLEFSNTKLCHNTEEVYITLTT